MPASFLSTVTVFTSGTHQGADWLISIFRPFSELLPQSVKYKTRVDDGNRPYPPLVKKWQWKYYHRLQKQAVRTDSITVHMRTHRHTQTPWFNHCGCTMKTLSPFVARLYCVEDSAGILMSSLYCLGLQRRGSVDYLLTSPPVISAPRSLSANNIDGHVCMCAFVFALA